MPLQSGKSKSAFHANIAAEVRAGKPVKQAVAIAYAKQRKMAEGGEVPPAEEAPTGGPQDPGGYVAGMNKLAHSDSEDFSESPRHGFPGGGAQSSDIQPAEILLDVAAAPLRAPVSMLARDAGAESAKMFPKGVPLGAADLGKMTKEEILEHFERLPSRRAAIMAAPEKNAALTRADSSARQAKHMGAIKAARGDYDAATAAAGQVAGPAQTSIAPEAVDAARLARQEKIAADRLATKAPAVRVTGEFEPGQAPHPGGLSPKQVVDKQKALIEEYLKMAGGKKYAKGGTVYPEKEAQRVAEEARLRAEAIPVVPPLASHSGYRPADPVTLNKRGVADAHVQRLNEAKTQHLPAMALPLDFSQTKVPEEFFAGLADRLERKHFAVGGVVQREDAVDPEAPREDVPDLQTPPAAAASRHVPHVVGVNLHDVEVHPQIVGVDTHDVSIDSIDPPPPDLAQSQLDRAATAEAVKEEGPNALEQIETQRRQDLADARPSTGRSVARTIGAGLLGFAGRNVPDFAAHDKAAEDAINAESDRRRNAYLSQPGDLVQRSAASADSPFSTNMRRIVSTATGSPELAMNMSGLELKAASPFISAYIQGNLSAAQLREKIEADRAKQTHDAGMLNVAQQNAETARLRALRESNKPQETNDRQFLRVLSNSYGAPEVGKANEALRRISGAEQLVNEKRPLTANEVKLLAGEMVQIATGGQDQKLTEELSSPLLQGKINQAIQYLSGHPGDAGYSEIVRKIYAPYLAKLKAAQMHTLRRHLGQVAAPWIRAGKLSPSLQQQFTDDPLFTLKAAEDLANSGDARDAAPAEDADPLKALGGQVHR